MISLSRALALLLFLVVPEAGRAQQLFYNVIYRPPDARYLVLESPHFDVVFQDGLDEEAREMAAILEATLPSAQALTGYRHRLRMPVVLNRFNDRSNGYVTPFAFRQEIEGVAIKGDILSPRFSSWLMAVGPHELTHALHADRRTGFGLGGLLRLLGPDLGRTVNLAAPSGITEGVAVYQESRLEPGTGRLHFSRFNMQFRAAMLSERPWSLAQMLERPAYTRPFDRFYIGGAHLFQELAAEDDGRFFRRATNLYGKWPFFGYGVPLSYGTGRLPHQVGRQFRRAARARETARLDSLRALGPLTEPNVLAEARGLVYRRPRWLSDEALVAYATGYNVRPGFYRIDAETGARRPIAHQGITEDVYYSLSRDTTALFFARYVPDPFVPIQALAEVFRLDLASGSVERLTDAGHALAPVEAPDGGLWVLQNDGQFNQWAHLGRGGVTPVTDYKRAFFKSLIPSPDGEAVAVLLNVRGHQGLFRARFDGQPTPQLEPWVVFEDASILEANWSPDGRYLLFSADPGGISNLYALDVRADRLLRLTNIPFGALDPALSPDGQTLAYIDYQYERYRLVTIPFRPEDATVVPRPAGLSDQPWEAWLRWTSGEAMAGTAPVALLDSLYRSLGQEEARPYRSYRRLWPRIAYPMIRSANETGGDEVTDIERFRFGLGVQGADPLLRWAYGGSAFYQAGRLWGEAAVQSGRWLLRPRLLFYNRPRTLSNTEYYGIEERGVEAGVSLPVVLAANVYQSILMLSLAGGFDQTRLIDDGAPAGAFTDRIMLRPSAVLAYRVQANARDLVPNTGLVLFTSAQADVRGERGSALITRLDLYLPFLRASNTGLRLNAGLLLQNEFIASNSQQFLPRGYGDALLGNGTFFRYGVEVFQPLWFVDNGFLLVPFYAKALYAYGFAESVRRTPQSEGRLSGGGVGSAVGLGLGFQFRLLHLLNLDLRLGAAFDPEARRWRAVYR